MNPLAADLDHILAHTGDIWESLRGQNIFVTGGTGFFGRWILESFAHANATLQLGARMVVLSRDPRAFKTKAPHLANNPAIKFLAGDVRTLSVAQLASKASAESFDYVIHAATESNSLLNVENPTLMLETVIAGTRAALEFAVATRARRFLLTSSGAVYGDQLHTVTNVTEGHNGAPDTTTASSAYAEGKRAAEVLCACYARQHSIEPVIARCFAFFGPHQPLDAHLATTNFLRDAICGGPIRVSGTGEDVRSYMYAADLAVWLWTLIVRGVGGRAYNVGSEKEVKIADWAREIRAAIAPAATTEVVGGGSGRAVSRYVPSTARARAELGLAETISRADGLSRLVRWLQLPGACRAGNFR